MSYSTVSLTFINASLTEFSIEGTALVVNTVAYGVKGVKGTKAVDEESTTVDIAASYDV